MKKILYLTICLILLNFLIIGCGGGGGGGTTPPRGSGTYIISIVDPNVHGTSAGFYNKVGVKMKAMASTINPSSDWFIDRKEFDYLWSGDFTKPIGEMWNPATVQAVVKDANGNEVQMTPDEAEKRITWTCPDYGTEKFNLSGDGNLTGYSVSINALKAGIYVFTATYQDETQTISAEGRIFVIDKGVNQINNTGVASPTGFSFTGQAQPDFWLEYDGSTNTNYICAPGGIELLIDTETIAPWGTGVWWRIASVIKIPDEVKTRLDASSRVTKLKCSFYGTYAIRARDGAHYAKVLSYRGDAYSGGDNYIATGFEYEVSTNGVFQYHF